MSGDHDCGGRCPETHDTTTTATEAQPAIESLETEQLAGGYQAVSTARLSPTAKTILVSLEIVRSVRQISVFGHRPVVRMKKSIGAGRKRYRRVRGRKPGLGAGLGLLAGTDGAGTGPICRQSSRHSRDVRDFRSDAIPLLPSTLPTNWIMACQVNCAKDIHRVAQVREPML